MRSLSMSRKIDIEDKPLMIVIGSRMSRLFMSTFVTAFEIRYAEASFSSLNLYYMRRIYEFIFFVIGTVGQV